MEEKLDYLLILDFEASCDDDEKFMNEIIEFPTLVYSIEKKEVIKIFHKYVQPTINKELTKFCKELTAIKQEWVDEGKGLKETLDSFQEFLIENKLITNDGQTYEKESKFAFLTCGDWDLNIMLQSQCKREKITVPWYFKRWVNIKHVFENIFKKESFGMKNMLEVLELNLDGHHHSGIDDCKNISKIVTKILSLGHQIKPTLDLNQSPVEVYFKNMSYVEVNPEKYPKATSSFKIFIGGKPSKPVTEKIKSENCFDCIVTSLKNGKEEGINKFSNMISSLKITWVHLPLGFKSPYVLGNEEESFFQSLNKLRDFKSGSRILFHCNGHDRSFISVYFFARSALGFDEESSWGLCEQLNWKIFKKLDPNFKLFAESFVKKFFEKKF
eukprot:TRINITY_DN5408_c0_g1_i1.p1 TRINITY_DN5408_c0_g1~~TRINITY_DN5408_c0_g1_i1.p1  ORF type:complete len:385 (+),score=88.78 TRINITY_DN5408_c0_g1_i1:2-1156(+)